MVFLNFIVHMYNLFITVVGCSVIVVIFEKCERFIIKKVNLDLIEISHFRKSWPGNCLFKLFWLGSND